MLPSQGPEVTPRTSRWPDRACTEQVIKVTARLSTTQWPSQTCGQLPAPPAPQHRAFPASAAAIYRAEPLVLGRRWKPAVPDRIWGAGRIQLQEQGGLKWGDLSSYPNLLAPLAFGEFLLQHPFPPTRRENIRRCCSRTRTGREVVKKHPQESRGLVGNRAAGKHGHVPKDRSPTGPEKRAVCIPETKHVQHSYCLRDDRSKAGWRCSEEFK